MTPHIETIRKACIAANPEIKEGCNCSTCHELPVVPRRPIRLADVLLAIGSVPQWADEMTVDAQGEMSAVSFDDAVAHWNLRRDSLEDQSPECLAFLASLLK